MTLGADSVTDMSTKWLVSPPALCSFLPSPGLELTSCFLFLGPAGTAISAAPAEHLGD